MFFRNFNLLVMSVSEKYYTLLYLDSFQPSVTFHIEASHLICIANQMAGFYVKFNTGLKWFSSCYFFHA